MATRFPNLVSTLQMQAETLRQTRNLDITAFFSATEQAFQADRFRDAESTTVERILIIRVDAAGDFITTSGFIRELRGNFPQAYITLLVSPYVYPLAELCPYVNEVIIYESSLPSSADLWNIIQCVADFCAKKLWDKHFSRAYCPQWGSNRLEFLLIAWLSGAKERIGYGTYPIQKFVGKEAPLFSAVVDNNLLTQNIAAPVVCQSETQTNFYILTHCGLSIKSYRLELWYGASDVMAVKDKLSALSAASGAYKILICIGAGEPSRQYPVNQFVTALNLILARSKAVFILTGGAQEKESAQFMAQNLPNGSVLDLTGRTSLRETAALCSQIDYYIGNDTGVMHMAAASHVPIVAIYREAKDKEGVYNGISSEFRRFPPWQVPAVVLRPDRAADECAEPHGRYGGCIRHKPHCIAQITPEQVAAGFETLLNLTYVGMNTN